MKESRKDLLSAEPDGHDDLNRKDIGFGECICVHITFIIVIVRDTKEEPGDGHEDGTSFKSAHRGEGNKDQIKNIMSSMRQQLIVFRLTRNKTGSLA